MCQVSLLKLIFLEPQRPRDTRKIYHGYISCLFLRSEEVYCIQTCLVIKGSTFKWLVTSTVNISQFNKHLWDVVERQILIMNVQLTNLDLLYALKC